MRILYLSISYVPSRRASAVHVMKMCAALSRAGHRVTLTTKANAARQEPGVTDPFGYYGVAPSFTLHEITRPSRRGGGLIHLRQSRRYLSSLEPPPDLIYSRDLAGAVVAGRGSTPIVFEAHGFPIDAVSRWLWRRLTASPRLRRLVVISHALQRQLEVAGLLPDALEVVVAPDASDPLPAAAANANDCRPFDRSGSRRHYGYVGQLYAGKGMELLVRLAAEMPHDEFHVVGGSRDDLERWRNSEPPENLRLHGFVPPSRLPSWFQRFDALLLPAQRRVLGASGRSSIGDVMSPMKLFEYMAAQKPIVSSDLPVLREVLRHEENCLLVDPEDVAGWKMCLARLDSEPDLARRIARSAHLEWSNSYTWDARVARVLDGL